MSLTVFGDAGGPNTLAATYDPLGRLVEARSYRELDLELPAEGLVVDADHSGERLGEVVFAELGSDARLRAVAVLDDDRLAQVEEPVFFSPLLDLRGGGGGSTYIARQGSLIGLSLTLSTARVGATPVKWWQGDLRDSVARGSWPVSWRGQHPLLARAIDNLGSDWRARTRTASRIVDRRESELVTADGLRVGDRVPPGYSRQLPGGLMKSGHRGRIIAVR